MQSECEAKKGEFEFVTQRRYAAGDLEYLPYKDQISNEELCDRVSLTVGSTEKLLKEAEMPRTASRTSDVAVLNLGF